MNRYKKIIGVIILLIVLMIILIGDDLTNGIIKESFLPYEGITVVLDAGHGGKDDGARYAGVKEQTINLNLVKELKIQLEQLGIKVILTRDGAYDLASDDAKQRKKEDIKKRVKMMNKEEVDFFISVHMNAYVNENVKGSQIYYKDENQASYKLASDIHREMIEITSKDMGIRKGNYYILENSDKVGILIEAGFLSNPIDRNDLINESYIKKLSIQIKKGIIQFLKDIYE